MRARDVFDHPDLERIYRGHSDQPSLGGTVTIETTDGQPLGPLPHIVHHSPEGFAWGRTGSGPSELSRCLLIDALDDQARCPTCSVRARPGCVDCDHGIRRDLPYQEFQISFVAGWGDTWTIRRSAIIAWVHGMQQP
jgi:uncharacterized protein DUF6166